MRRGKGPEHHVVSARTAAYARTVLRIALQHAVRLGTLPANPVDRTKGPRQAPKQVQAFTPEQVMALLAQAKETRMRTLLEFAALSGLRRGQILALHWADVDLDVDAGTVHVHRSRVHYEGRRVREGYED